MHVVYTIYTVHSTPANLRTAADLKSQADGSVARTPFKERAGDEPNNRY